MGALEISSTTAVLVALFVIAIGYFVFKQRSNITKTQTPKQPSLQSEPITESPAENSEKPSTKKGSTKATKIKPVQEVHPLRYGIVKGPFNDITCVAFSYDGSLLAVGCDERSFFLYNTESIRSPTPKFTKVAVEYDYPTAITFDHTGQQLLIATKESRKIIFYPLVANPPKIQASIGFQFVTSHKDTIKYLSMEKDGRFIISAGGDEEIRVWSPKGQLLQQVKTNQVKNYLAVSSFDTRFFSCATWAPDVKIWEATFNKDKTFNSLKKVMDLKGHNSSIWSASFSKDSRLALSCSKDGTIRLWNIDVRYQMEEDPRCITKITQAPDMPFTLASLSPDTRVIVSSSKSNLQFWSAADGSLLDTISHAHADAITQLLWCPTGQYVATIAGDRSVAFWSPPTLMPGSK